MKSNIILLFLISTLNFSCGSETTAPQAPEEPEEVVEPPITYEVSGFVYYMFTLIPIEGVTISGGMNSATTNAEGYYQLKDVQEGNQTLSSRKTGFDAYSAAINVSRNMTQDIFLTTTQFAKVLSGQIRTIDNILLEKVRITILNPDGSPSELTDVTDFNGNYSLGAVPQGNRLVTIENYDNTAYDLLPDKTEVLIANVDKTLDIRGKIRRTALESFGIEHPEHWIMDGWEANSTRNRYITTKVANQDYGGYRPRLTLGNAIEFPEDAENIVWNWYIETGTYGGTTLYVNGVYKALTYWNVDTNDWITLQSLPNYYRLNESDLRGSNITFDFYYSNNSGFMSIKDVQVYYYY